MIHGFAPRDGHHLHRLLFVGEERLENEIDEVYEILRSIYYEQCHIKY